MTTTTTTMQALIDNGHMTHEEALETTAGQLVGHLSDFEAGTVIHTERVNDILEAADADKSIDIGRTLKVLTMANERTGGARLDVMLRYGPMTVVAQYPGLPNDLIMRDKDGDYCYANSAAMRIMYEMIEEGETVQAFDTMEVEVGDDPHLQRMRAAYEAMPDEMKVGARDMLVRDLAQATSPETRERIQQVAEYVLGARL